MWSDYDYAGFGPQRFAGCSDCMDGRCMMNCSSATSGAPASNQRTGE